MVYRPKSVKQRIHSGQQPSSAHFGDLWLDGSGCLRIRTPTGWALYPHKKLDNILVNQRKKDFAVFHTWVACGILIVVALVVWLIWR